MSTEKVAKLSVIEHVEMVDDDQNVSLSFSAKIGIILQIFCGTTALNVYGLIFLAFTAWGLGAVTVKYVFNISWGPSIGFGIIFGLLYALTMIILIFMFYLIANAIKEKYKTLKNEKLYDESKKRKFGTTTDIDQVRIL